MWAWRAGARMSKRRMGAGAADQAWKGSLGGTVRDKRRRNTLEKKALRAEIKAKTGLTQHKYSCWAVSARWAVPGTARQLDYGTSSPVGSANVRIFQKSSHFLAVVGVQNSKKKK